MVDLVKIRQKAKAKKDLAEKAEQSPGPDEVESKAPAPELKPSGAKAAKPREKPESDPPVAASPDASAAAPSTGKPPRKKNDADIASPQTASDETVTAARQVVDAGEPDEESLDRLARFKREAGKRRTWVAAATGTGSTTAEEDAARELELLRFRLAGEEYAVEIEKIVEIVPPRATTRVPNAEHWIVGIMSLRGTIVTVFDLRRRLGHPPIGDGQDAERRMIVVEREGETAGFLVDRVSRVVKLDPSELESHPVVSAAEQSDYVGGVFQASDGLVILLDLEKILASHS